MEELSTNQIDSFIPQGFIRIDHAFPLHIADACRTIL